MTAKEYLLKYRDATREARDVELKITQLRIRYGAASAINYSDMPKAHNNSDLSDYVIQLERLESCLYGKYKKCLTAMEDVETRLDRMDNQLEREVLRHRYTEITDAGKLTSWEDVADAVHYSRRTVERVHGQALQHFPLD